MRSEIQKLKNENHCPCTTPVIEFYSGEFIRGFNRNPVAFYEFCDTLRLRVKEAIGYTWGNWHMQITGNWAGAQPVTVLPSDSTVTLWTQRGTSIGTYTHPLDVREFEKIIEEAGRGLLNCNKCRKWFKPEEGRTYSFAGWVCKDCYDPKVHLPPDTRGD